MPLFRCTEPECGHEWFVLSHLSVGGDCEECGAGTIVVGRNDDEPSPPQDELIDRAHPAYARTRARQVAKEHGFQTPPIVAHAIARRLGFTITQSNKLGTLRARLVGRTIEVNADEPPVAQRFSVAHELGHHFLGTQHGAGEAAELEADAFAGELLVPGPMLREALQQTSDASELRTRFRVSRDVLEIAARTHRLWDKLTGI